ncbi:MAG: hypothetical protein BJ554DRAFT_122, partial [Olpidium bornovanus]
RTGPIRGGQQRAPEGFLLSDDLLDFAPAEPALFQGGNQGHGLDPSNRWSGDHEARHALFSAGAEFQLGAQPDEKPPNSQSFVWEIDPSVDFRDFEPGPLNPPALADRLEAICAAAEFEGQTFPPPQTASVYRPQDVGNAAARVARPQVCETLATWPEPALCAADTLASTCAPHGSPKLKAQPAGLTAARAAAAPGPAAQRPGGGRLRGVRKRKKKDPNAPKHPRSAFLFYLSDTRAEVAARCPEGTKMQSVTRFVADMWKGMTEEQKRPWLEVSDADKRRYAEEMDAYISRLAAERIVTGRAAVPLPVQSPEEADGR